MDIVLIKSPEYVLGELDKWYADRVRKNYTEKDSKDLEKLISGVVEEMKEQISPRLRMKINQDLLEICSVESQYETARKCFSTGYATVESLKEGFEIKGQKVSDIPEGVRQEYFDGAFAAYEQLQNFVNLVRKKCDEKFPEQLTTGDIDNAFIDIFGNWEGYCKFSENLSDATLLTLNYAAITGQIPQKAYLLIEKIYSSYKPLIKNFCNRIFGDIQRNT